MINLPHCQYIEAQSPQNCIDHLMDRANEEIYLTVSKDFYEVEDQEAYESMYQK